MNETDTMPTPESREESEASWEAALGDHNDPTPIADAQHATWRINDDPYTNMYRCAQRLERAIATLTGERDQAKRESQVCMDLHDALGVRWGDDPYARIRELNAAAYSRSELATERDEAVQLQAIQVEKMLCAKLGIEWRATGMSVESLINRLAEMAEKKQQEERTCIDCGKKFMTKPFDPLQRCSTCVCARLR